MLMQVHWLRVVLDEGHQIGSSLGITNKLQMACSLRAERRWVMTGTPTPDNVGQGASHLLPLLKFIHEPQYGLLPSQWGPSIQRPLESGNPKGAELLQNLLSRVMIRASKEDLEVIPKCKHDMRKLHFEEVHAKNYNEFVAIVQRNLLLADCFDEKHTESILHSSKLKVSRKPIQETNLQIEGLIG